VAGWGMQGPEMAVIDGNTMTPKMPVVKLELGSHIRTGNTLTVETAWPQSAIAGGTDPRTIPARRRQNVR
jgi:hypothetical protein